MKELAVCPLAELKVVDLKQHHQHLRFFAKIA
jgi:hypothetical protein